MADAPKSSGDGLRFRTAFVNLSGQQSWSERREWRVGETQTDYLRRFARVEMEQSQLWTRQMKTAYKSNIISRVDGRPEGPATDENRMREEFGQDPQRTGRAGQKGFGYHTALRDAQGRFHFFVELRDGQFYFPDPDHIVLTKELKDFIVSNNLELVIFETTEAREMVMHADFDGKRTVRLYERPPEEWNSGKFNFQVENILWNFTLPLNFFEPLALGEISGEIGREPLRLHWTEPRVRPYRHLDGQPKKEEPSFDYMDGLSPHLMMLAQELGRKGGKPGPQTPFEPSSGTSGSGSVGMETARGFGNGGPVYSDTVVVVGRDGPHLDDGALGSAGMGGRANTNQEGAADGIAKRAANYAAYENAQTYSIGQEQAMKQAMQKLAQDAMGLWDELKHLQKMAQTDATGRKQAQADGREREQTGRQKQNEAGAARKEGQKAGAQTRADAQAMGVWKSISFKEMSLLPLGESTSAMEANGTPNTGAQAMEMPAFLMMESAPGVHEAGLKMKMLIGQPASLNETQPGPDGLGQMNQPRHETGAESGALQHRPASYAHLQIRQTAAAQVVVAQAQKIRAAKGKKKKTKFVPSKSNSAPLRAILFDLDGVLADSETLHLQTFNETFAPYGVRIARAYWDKHYLGTGSRHIVQELMAKYKLSGADEDGLVAARKARFQQAVLAGRLKPVAGALELVAWAKSRGLRIAIASGGHKDNIAAQLQALGLEDIPFVGLEDVKRRKPDPEVFLKAAAGLGMRPDECLIIEDSAAGAQAARRGGMRCVLIGPQHGKEEREGAALYLRRMDGGKIERYIEGQMGGEKGGVLPEKKGGKMQKKKNVKRKTKRILFTQAA
ncbi:Phosphoglycolate phosphatase [uncultured archaeon]|nr:Phosphoglycolate phosphatase [uncultured archaeon]